MNVPQVCAYLALIAIPATLTTFSARDAATQEQHSKTYQEEHRLNKERGIEAKKEVLSFLDTLDGMKRRAKEVLASLKAQGGQAANPDMSQVKLQMSLGAEMMYSACQRQLDNVRLWAYVIGVKGVQDKTMTLAERDLLIQQADKAMSKFRNTVDRRMKSFRDVIQKM